MKNKSKNNRRKTAKKSTKKTKPKDPFPPSMTVDLKYTHVRSFGSASLAYIYNAYNFNSAYDPDDSGVGSQPLGYDQWSAFYTRYFINDATIRVTATNVTSNPVIFGIIPQLDNSPQTDIAAVISNPMCVWTLLAPLNSGDTTKTLVKSCNMRYLYANPGINDSQDDYTGLTGNVGTGSSPARNGFFHVFFSTLNGAVIGTNAVQYVMNLQQICKFCRRNDIAQS